MPLPTLTRDSEPYSPRGNVASEGVRNQLGRPRMDPIGVFVREAVQNCWDAHLPDDPHIEIEIGWRTLNAAQQTALVEHILVDPAPATLMDEQLARADAGISVLWITDRGTSGLGGPTRADAVADAPAGTATDFVDFLRNVGQPPDKERGGGTFGYGKAALFRLSGCGTLLVHTRCTVGERIESRFMGAGLGPQFVEEVAGRKVRYTGRHWWGLATGDETGLVDPVVGSDADVCANALGLPGFIGDERGTTIVVVDPLPNEERTPAQTMKLMVDALLWNFWPKMLAEPEGRPAIRFSVVLEGQRLSVPDPREWYPLDGFICALENLEDHHAGRRLRHVGDVVPILRYRTQQLGLLSLIRFPFTKLTKERRKRAALVGGLERETASHVALMRSPRLIVTYREHVPLMSDTWQYAGVFLADDDFDRAFAGSEPPTHDDWVSAQLDNKTDRSVVKLALERIGKETLRFAHPTASDMKDVRGEGLGPLSAQLGQMLIGLDREPERRRRVRPARPAVKPSVDEEPTVETASEEKGTSSKTGAPDTDPRPLGRPAIRVVDGELVIHQGVGALSTRFRLRHGKRATGTRLSVVATARLEGGGREKEPPEGAETPSVVAWCNPAGEHIEPDDEGGVEGRTEGEWRVLVSLLDDAAIDVVVKGSPFVDEDG